MNAKRKKAEELIYKYFNALDPTKANTNFYKELFANMSDDEFLKFCKRKLPFRAQTSPLKWEPRCEDITASLKAIGVPTQEAIVEPYRYKDSNSNAIKTKDCIIAYINLVPLKQMLSKKNGYGSDNSMRETKSGRLTGHDKGGISSDREIESLILFNSNQTLSYLTHEMADDNIAKQEMLTQINTTGMYSQRDIHRSNSEQTSKNTVTAYLIGSCIYTNMILQDYMTPYTIAERKKKTERET